MHLHCFDVHFHPLDAESSETVTSGSMVAFLPDGRPVVAWTFSGGVVLSTWTGDRFESELVGVPEVAGPVQDLELAVGPAGASGPKFRAHLVHLMSLLSAVATLELQGTPKHQAAV